MIRLTRYGLMTSLSLTLTAWPAVGQDVVGVTSATYYVVARDGPHIEVAFGQSFGTSDAVEAAKTASAYRLLDVMVATAGGHGVERIPVTVVVPVLQGLRPEQGLIVRIVPDRPLDPSTPNRYVLIVSNLTFGEEKIPVDTRPVGVGMSSSVGPPPKMTMLGWTAAGDRDEADLFFSGMLSRSGDDPFFGAVDIKARYPLERQVGDRVHYLSPVFDLATSANPDADADGMKVGYTWLFEPVTIPRRYLPTMAWENAVEFESQKDFDATNLIWRSELTLLPKAWAHGWINPIVGLALGRMIAVPVETVSKGNVVRALVGGTATAQATTFGKKVTATAGYQWRYLFQPELIGEIALGEGGHGWLSISGEVGFTDYVSFGAAFKDGRQPPSFKVVDRSLTLDLTFKAKRERKPGR
jgi:hypothetical protein